MDYHGQIMNIGANCTHAESPREDVMRAYMEGHKRARHEAAEIAKEADAEIDRLRDLADEYNRLMRHMDAGGDFFAFQVAEAARRNAPVPTFGGRNGS